MQVHLYGKPLVEGKTVTLDHTVQKFEILIRSMSGVHASRLKDLIQKQFEVVKIKEVDSISYVI